MMHLDEQTKFITLIGTPLSQSYAARMQNAAYKAMGVNMHYFYTEADGKHLGEIINGIRYMPSFAGCAVTKPNKVKVLQHLDELDPLCAKMGACNTVVKTPDGMLMGYNTDGIGFVRSITEDAGICIEGNTFFCFGAGGAGRAICSAVAYHKAGKIYITDVVAQAAQNLVDHINTEFAPIADTVRHDDYMKIGECHVVINASGIGMGDTRGKSPLPEAYICSDQLYFDACYNPDKTQFLLNAERKGCRTQNGLGMSLYQGAAQIELWTGRTAPVDAMRRELTAIMEE